MSNQILVYFLYIMAVITIILAFGRYELQYHMTSFLNPDYDSKRIRRRRLEDAFNTVMTIIASAYPIKFRFFEIKDMLPWYVLFQIVLLVTTYKHIGSIKRLIYSRYFLDALERKNKGLEPALTPWFDKDLSILNNVKRLDDGLIKYMTEAIEEFKKSKNTGNSRNNMSQ